MFVKTDIPPLDRLQKKIEKESGAPIISPSKVSTPSGPLLIVSPASIIRLQFGLPQVSFLLVFCYLLLCC